MLPISEQFANALTDEFLRVTHDELWANEDVTDESVNDAIDSFITNLSAILREKI